MYQLCVNLVYVWKRDTILAVHYTRHQGTACVVHTIIKLVDSAFSRGLSEVPCNSPVRRLLQGTVTGVCYKGTVTGDWYRGLL